MFLKQPFSCFFLLKCYLCNKTFNTCCKSTYF